jgi:hypothetical protein
MIDPLTRIVANLAGRITGPLTFRLVLQPAVAIIAGIRAGVADARADKPAWLWSVFTSRAHRRELLRDGWKDITKIFVAAVTVDVIYQWIAQRWIYPGEALLVAFVLACVPYALIRGPVNRLARLWMRRGVRTPS